jgi:hypothetical protein
MKLKTTLLINSIRQLAQACKDYKCTNCGSSNLYWDFSTGMMIPFSVSEDDDSMDMIKVFLESSEPYTHVGIGCADCFTAQDIPLEDWLPVEIEP